MADLPPDHDAAPDYPESAFLIRRWTHLDAAENLSIGADVLSRLDDIAQHCQGAIDEIRAWQRGPRDR